MLSKMRKQSTLTCDYIILTRHKCVSKCPTKCEQDVDTPAKIGLQHSCLIIHMSGAITTKECYYFHTPNRHTHTTGHQNIKSFRWTQYTVIPVYTGYRGGGQRVCKQLQPIHYGQLQPLSHNRCSIVHSYLLYILMHMTTNKADNMSLLLHKS